MNAMLDETRSERIDLGLPFLKQIRVSPTIHEFLKDHKPDNRDWGTFILSRAVSGILADYNVRFDFRGLNRQVVRLFGSEKPGLGVSSEDQADALLEMALADNRQVATAGLPSVRNARNR